MYKEIFFLADAFEKTCNMCLKEHILESTNLLSVTELGRKAALKKIEVQLELLTNIDMLSTVEKSIRGGICHVIHQYMKANKNT